MEIAAILISIFALIFTLFSFWWMHWRKGKIKIGSNLRTYAACASNNKLMLEIPLIFFNTGPIPLVVENLRLYFPEIKESNKYLFFNATVEKIGTDKGRAFATPFCVPGGGIVSLICEFQNTETSFQFSSNTCSFSVEVLRGFSNKWVKLREFSINPNQKDLETLNNAFITHDNQN